MAELVKALNSNLCSNDSMGYARACSNHAVDVILFAFHEHDEYEGMATLQIAKVHAVFLKSFFIAPMYDYFLICC